MSILTFEVKYEDTNRPNQSRWYLEACAKLLHLLQKWPQNRYFVSCYIRGPWKMSVFSSLMQ